MANEAINHLHKLGPTFSHDLYPVDNKGGSPETETVTRAVSKIGKGTCATDTATRTVIGVIGKSDEMYRM